jgi:hypothetical protein
VLLTHQNKIQQRFLEAQEVKLDGDAVVQAVANNDRFKNLIDKRAKALQLTPEILLRDEDFMKTLTGILADDRCLINTVATAVENRQPEKEEQP